MRVIEYANMLKELAPAFREVNDTDKKKEVSSFNWKMTGLMKESEWEGVRARALQDIDGYSMSYLGKGNTELQAALDAFETAIGKGWNLEKYRLWPVLGKFDNDPFKHRRAMRGADEGVHKFYYFMLLVD